MIADMRLKGKQYLDFLIIPAIVILVGIAAFGLGRLSALQGAHTGLTIHPAPGENQ